MSVLARRLAAALGLLILTSHAALGQSAELVEAYDLFKDLQERGRYEEAMFYGRRAVKLGFDELRFNNRSMAILIANLAYLEAAEGSFDEAMTQYVIALTILERSTGPQHSDVAWVLGHIAWLHQVEGNYAEAERLLQRALAIREKMLERDDPEIFWTLTKYAALLRATGRAGEARELEARAAAIRAKNQ